MRREEINAMLDGLAGVTPGRWFAKHRRIYRYHEEGEFAHISAAIACDVADLDAAHIARCDPDTIRSILTELLELRAENERLLAAMVKARDGLRWSQIHLREADMCSVSVEVGLDAAQEVLERKPE